jgi:membrane protease YdiL (CAAX protease family)
MVGPAIAALIMRRVGSEPLRGSLGAKRPWRYYVIAVAAPALFVTSVVLIDVAAGLGKFDWPQSPMLTFAAVLFVGGAVTLPLAIGEEYGWRGYLLPRLLPLGEARATLVLALIWGSWHLPILLIGLNYPGQFVWAVLPVFVASVALTAFPFTWLYVASDERSGQTEWLDSIGPVSSAWSPVPRDDVTC